MRRLAIGVTLVVVLAGCNKGDTEPDPVVTPTLSPSIVVTQEDDPRWQCDTDGNAECDPVTPGAFCKRLGARAVTKTGKEARCLKRVGERQPRWRTQS